MMNNFLVTVNARSSFNQLIRYAFVGIMSNSAGYLVYFLFTYLGVTPKITMTLLYSVFAAIGYIGNRKYTFSHKGNLLGSGARYFLAHFSGYFINLALLIIFVDHLGYAHQLVQAIAIFVVAIFLFLAFKYFVFRSMNVSNVDRI